MQTLAWTLLATPVALLLFAYLGYPGILWVAGRLRSAKDSRPFMGPWPQLTITVPCYNEQDSIADTLDSLLALDYPGERPQLLVISDASTDRTDEIVKSYAGAGVELVRLETRSGKTAAENAATKHVRGEIIVNTDATIRIVPGALGELIAAFQDPTVGVASGRDISVSAHQAGGGRGESGYVGYEMWVRSLETRVGSIVGASGCFFAIRRELFDGAFPEALSRDFASCLIAREQGYRSVSVDSACALVPRSGSLQSEYRRKVRTMARGLGTLHYKRHLLNPARYGSFSLMLFGHKLCRWLFQLTMPLVVPGGALVVLAHPWAASWTVLGAAGLAAIALSSWRWNPETPMPPLLAVPGYFVWSNVAGVAAWVQFFRRKYQPVWEPTRRSGPV